jgi:hypothetical protein
MKRLCLVGVGFLCSVAAANAESPTVAHSKPVRAHAAKATGVKVIASNNGLAGVNFSDPYAPPVGTQKAAAVTKFPAPPTDDPVEVKGGFSLTAGRDAAGEPMTGGLKFRF